MATIRSGGGARAQVSESDSVTAQGGSGRLGERNGIITVKGWERRLSQLWRMAVKDRIGTLEVVLTVRVDSRNPKTSVRYTPEALLLSHELRLGKLSGETRGWIAQSEIEQHFN